MRQKLPRVYREDPLLKMEKVFLEEDVHAKALEAYIKVCVDAVIINSQRCTFFLDPV